MRWYRMIEAILQRKYPRLEIRRHHLPARVAAGRDRGGFRYLNGQISAKRQAGVTIAPFPTDYQLDQISKLDSWWTVPVRGC